MPDLSMLPIKNLVKVLGGPVPKLLLIHMPVPLGGAIVVVPAHPVDPFQIRVDVKNRLLACGLDTDILISTRMERLSLPQKGIVMNLIFFKQVHSGGKSVHKQALAALSVSVRQ